MGSGELCRRRDLPGGASLRPLILPRSLLTVPRPDHRRNFATAMSGSELRPLTGTQSEEGRESFVFVRRA